MAVTDYRGNIVFHDTVTCAGSFILPAGCVADSNVAQSADISALKLEHQHPITHHFADESSTDGTTVGEADKLIHITRTTGSIIALEAAVMVAATGADRTVTVDLQKVTGGGAFSSVMTSTIVLTNASVARVVQAGVVNNVVGGLVTGDILKLVVTVAGASGNQAKGLVVTTTIRESAS